jgi:hypothetical protein
MAVPNDGYSEVLLSFPQPLKEKRGNYSPIITNITIYEKA